MAGLGTSEPFMHHPANDRYWPKVASDEAFTSVGFGESLDEIDYKS